MPLDTAETTFRIEAAGPELLGRTPLYGAGEARCRARTGEPSVERVYAGPCIGVVIEGVFDYRAQNGCGWATPGAAVFGNAGEAFACGHVDETGNRRAVIAFSEAAVAEVANDLGLPVPAFGAAVLAASRQGVGLYGAIRRAAVGGLGDDEALDLIGWALLMSHRRAGPAISARDRTRIGEVVRRLAFAYDQPMTLDEMAGIAGLSRYHFVRVFRAVVGDSPHQHLIAARLRAAADRLLDTKAPVTDIAFSVGFNDLSHFNATFRRAFGRSPGAWRAAA